MSSAKKLPRGNGSAVVILGVLRLHPKGLSGIDIARAASALAEGAMRLPYATLYPQLHSLEEAGLIHGRTERDEERGSRGGQARRFWRITKDGRAALHIALNDARVLVEAFSK